MHFFSWRSSPFAGFFLSGLHFSRLTTHVFLMRFRSIGSSGDSSQHQAKNKQNTMREREREREAEREKEIAREGWGSPTGDVGRRGNACSQSHGLNIETACLERQEPYPHEPNTVPAVTKISNLSCSLPPLIILWNTLPSSAQCAKNTFTVSSSTVLVNSVRSVAFKL